MEFTEKILKIMDERGISAYEICKNLKISNTTFSSWKKGSKPSIDKAIEILRYLQLSADEIFELTKTDYTDEEKQIIDAYRLATPAIQTATKKLLDVPETENIPKPKSETSSTSRTG